MHWTKDPTNAHALSYMGMTLRDLRFSVKQADDAGLRRQTDGWDRSLRGEFPHQVPPDILEATEESMSHARTAGTAGMWALASKELRAIEALWATPLDPPFHERTIVDGDGVAWGVRATNPAVARGFNRPPKPGTAPRERWMEFLSREGVQRIVPIGLDDPSHRDATDAELLELLGRAE